MVIRPMESRYLPRAMKIWIASVQNDEVVYYPLTELYFKSKFAICSGALSLAADEGGLVQGFICGNAKSAFLPGETAENTPGYLTCIFVDRGFRRRGFGMTLLDGLGRAFRMAGKRRVCCSGGNTVNLDWNIPETPGHDHNNAPGMDVDCAGYPFLLCYGFSALCLEDAIYLDLAGYREPAGVGEIRAKLLADGVATGRYGLALGYDYAGCARTWAANTGTRSSMM